MIEITDIPLFKDFNSDQLNEIAPLLRQQKYKKNHVFMFENDNSDDIYILRAGKVKIYRIQEGKEVVLSFQQPGDIIGEAEAITGDSYRIASIEAIEPVVAWKIQKQDFLSIVDRYPSVLRKCYDLMFQRVRVLNRTIRYLTFFDVRTKVANLILDLYYNFGVQEDASCKIDMKFNHALLGSMIGVTRESITKTLGDFQSEGLLDIQQKYIYLLDVDRLEHISGEAEEAELRKW